METSRLLGRVHLGAQEQPGANVCADVAGAYDTYAASLYRYLLALVSDTADAEDALQEVFLGLLRRPRGRSIDHLPAYLFRAARNQALIALRKRRGQERAAEAASLSWVEPEACAPEQREIAMDIDRILRELPADQREVVVLRLSEGLTFREIAEVVGVPLGTVASRYRAALTRVREGLQEGEGDA